MQPFGLIEAEYFCGAYTPEVGLAEGSFETFYKTSLQGHKTISEGTAIFREYRACALRDVDRSLFFAASHYRRALDALIPSGSPWAHVTMYYGAWFAARAILGMFGCAVFKKHVVDVAKSNPGSQQLAIRRIGNKIGEEATTHGGPHRQFWDFFYRAATPIRAFVSPSLTVGLTPINGDPIWQIRERNEINYDTHVALKAAEAFQRNFSTSTFPTSLPGTTATQYGVLESLLEAAFKFAHDFQVATDGLAALSPGGSRSLKIRELIYTEHPPSLVSKTRKKIVTN